MQGFCRQPSSSFSFPLHFGLMLSVLLLVANQLLAEAEAVSSVAKAGEEPAARNDFGLLHPHHHRSTIQKRSSSPPEVGPLHHGEGGGRQMITDCMTVTSVPGAFAFRQQQSATSSSDEPGQTCGVYIVAGAEEVVAVEFEVIDVGCDDGLVVFLDGWEMNGKIFPDVEDHQLPMPKRFTEMCSRSFARRKKKTRRTRRFVSSQNAALIQYRIPQQGEGFAFRVSFLPNPQPCNVLMSEMSGVVTLRNFGEARNCSLTTLLYPANLRVIEMSVGGQEKEECCVGGDDLVEFGGSADLQSRDLLTRETLCGCDAKRIENKGVTVLCGSTTVRLVSSGRHDNSISLLAKAAAEEEDLDPDKNLLLMCPDFM